MPRFLAYTLAIATGCERPVGDVLQSLAGAEQGGDTGLDTSTTDTADSAPPDDTATPNCANGADDDGDGWVDADDPDCLDSDRERGIGRWECNDGVDNDGDGQVDAADPDCSRARDLSEVEGHSRAPADVVAVAALYVPILGALFGSSIGAGDLDGNGARDLVIGAWNGGAAFYDVGTRGLAGPVDISGASARLGAGDAVFVDPTNVAVADLDGDAIDDLLVSATIDLGGHTESCAPRLLRGPWTGDADLSGATRILPDWYSKHAWGACLVAAGGDLDGDGVPDALVGDGAYGSGLAELYVVPGPLDRERTLAEATAAVRLLEGIVDDGSAVLAGHDFDGDGLDDLVLAGRDEAWIFWGPLAGSMDQGDAGVEWAGKDLSGLASADMDGDGTVDVLIGAPTSAYEKERTGGVHVATSPLASGALEELALHLWDSEGARAGSTVGNAGDLDGDGFEDVVVGAPYASAGEQGSAYVVRGPVRAALDLEDADLVLDGREPGGLFGSSVAGVGDADGGGLPDFAVGADAAGLGGPGSGAVYLYLGERLF